MKILTCAIAIIVGIAIVVLINDIFGPVNSGTQLRQVPDHSVLSYDASISEPVVDSRHQAVSPILDASTQLVVDTDKRQVQIRTILEEVLAGRSYEVRELYCADNYCILKVVGEIFGDPNGKTEEEQIGPFNLQKIEPASECATTGTFKDTTDGARGIATVFYYDSTNETDCFDRREER